MTTIAYKDGIIAYDGRCTAGGTIVYDDFDKLREREGVRFIGAGSTNDINELVDAYFGQEINGDCDARLMVIEAEALMLIGHSDGRLWKSPLVFDRPYAVGSGSDHALTAMDMGATAYQAVEIAMKRDSCTGGKIRTITVKQEQ